MTPNCRVEERKRKLKMGWRNVSVYIKIQYSYYFMIISRWNLAGMDDSCAHSIIE